ncbi:MAG: calcium/sodium antiporter [Demequinaceae bacterium]|nr:calcium/sodium antiporter [Demequinaceae bacterium]
MGLAIVEVVVGLVVLGLSADRFIMGSAAVARHLGLPALLIGMVIIGFGTSAPEMVVTTFASVGGNPEIALGNAYGSNISNIALILGITALVVPIVVHKGVIRVEIPMLLGTVALALWQFRDHELSRVDAFTLLVVFAAFLTWSFLHALRKRGEQIESDAEEMVGELRTPPRRAALWLVAGLILLVASSFVLVEGAKELAHQLGMSDLVIGLTVVAVGTSLPELASALAAARRREHDLVIGNIIGSCIFNSLGVVGLAGVIHPASVDPLIVSRDLPVYGLVVVFLGLAAFRFRRDRRITRLEGGLLIVTFITYVTYLLVTSV